MNGINTFNREDAFVFGVNVITLLISTLQSGETQILDMRYFRTLLEHKNINYDRMKYIYIKS
ncbi:hypothetical protein GCM10010912_50030 [Paenibacillus albidus]|uniref:Uncharacterized protein n=1 Tax=Paenibacillus albidus TaxID=2041023 RepID=A0A917CXR8_9BACL|nr:hypothetical protein GCM10010912_50030 [Paenibacillus albidus]